jgi:hypothetical protein
MLFFCGSTLLCASFACFLIGLALFLTRGAPAAARVISTAAPRRARAPAARPTPTAQGTGSMMHNKLANARVGQSATFRHPKRGDITAKISGLIRYTELWQTGSGANAPWAPTGNTFIALWMGDYMLYGWQDRLYLFDEGQDLTDQQINTSFLPYAKQFAQSNQTEKVTFAWPPATWTILDIGKYAVASAEGEGLRLNAGAQGRFIHATSDDKRVLVVEDYQSGGGGKDTVWLGWQITWDDVKRIG